ncbi:phosphoserine phosphatase RsbU/P [Gammaproteobacteria bacterium]
MMPKLSYHILLVDDSPTIHIAVHSTMQQYIDDCTLDIFYAKDGLQALEILAQQEVDLIVTDLEMPAMDGFALISHLRKQPAYQHTPILFLTAHSGTKEKIRAFDLGATDYLVKPFIPQELRVRVMGYLERQRAYQTIQQQNAQIEEELEHAREMQKIILPHFLCRIPHAGVYAKYLPMIQIGGDFYDIFELGPNQFGLMVADVSGHGIPAALLSFMISGIFKYSAQGLFSTKMVLNLVNGIIYGKLPEGRFATMFYGIYDAEQQILTYSSASHPPALVLRPKTGEIFRLKTTGNFIGLFNNELARYGELQFSFEPGDRLLLYTDGIQEVLNDDHKMLGLNRIENFLRENANLPLDNLLDDLLKYSIDYSNHHSLDDDATLLGLEVLPLPHSKP